MGSDGSGAPEGIRRVGAGGTKCSEHRRSVDERGGLEENMAV